MIEAYKSKKVKDFFEKVGIKIDENSCADNYLYLINEETNEVLRLEAEERYNNVACLITTE